MDQPCGITLTQDTQCFIVIEFTRYACIDQGLCHVIKNEAGFQWVLPVRVPWRSGVGLRPLQPLRDLTIV